MFRHISSHTSLVFALVSLLAATTSLVRCARAAPEDVVDLQADPQHNPPASTTDKSTRPPAATTDSEKPTAKGAKEIKEAAKEEVAQEKLKLRAGERVGANARGTAQVLGMALQEGPQERVKVVDVAMNSPAFDAGVMKGDEIIAFQGFRGETYRKWIDGIRRLTADTRAGLKIPVVVVRDGQRLTVRIEVPEKVVRPSTPRGLAQPGSPLIPAGVEPALPTTGGATAVAVNGGNNVAIDNSGPFGTFFGAQAASPNERAVAQIMRIGGQPSPNPGTPQTPTAGATAAPINAGARIGLAGFRDDPTGMTVMVDVGALPSGNYTVGISDPSVIGGAAVTGTGAVNPNVQAPSQPAPPQPPLPAPESGGGLVPKPAAPVPADKNQPQGSLPPGSGSRVPRTVLAQVDATLSAPATGEVNPANSAPTGPANVNSPQRAQGAIDAGPNNRSTGVGGGILIQIGTITIDQSGTGRMQQKVETVRVRDVVGQAIVLYSQGGAPQTTLPANLNGSAGAATRQGAIDSLSARGSQPTGDANSSQRPAAARQSAALQQAAGRSQVPVAAGIIQLVTDRRPPPTTGPQTSQAPAKPDGAVEQPASATPPAGQNLVR